MAASLEVEQFPASADAKNFTEGLIAFAQFPSWMTKSIKKKICEYFDYIQLQSYQDCKTNTICSFIFVIMQVTDVNISIQKTGIQKHSF